MAGAAEWESVRDRLTARAVTSLDPQELELLADAWFWLDDPDESMVVRRLAYRRHRVAGDDDRSAAAAWRLFFDHHLVGESAQASGWLERCRLHSQRCADPARLAWCAVAEAARALADGATAEAAAAGRRAVHHSRAGADPNALAMALQADGMARLAVGDQVEGLRRLDEAMLGVVNGELDPLYTGWVYCNVISSCYGIGDLRRAAEWSSAALRWCESLEEGSMYPGLCRVYAVELAWLRGEWAAASAQVEQACSELMAFDPRYAGAAFGLAGDLHRMRGELTAAEEAYAQAHALGVSAQPGRALLLRDRGRPADALRSLRTALAPATGAPLPRAQLLAALVDLAVELHDHQAVDAAASELVALATQAPDGLIGALATAAAAEVALARGEHEDAVAGFRTAADILRRQRFPYEAARRQVRLAAALTSAGDRVGADLEIASARKVFVELGARLDVKAIDRPSATRVDTDCPLTARELEVLEQAARGSTNRAIGAVLVISEHTVARHLSNIRTKLGVASRTAAAAVAIDAGWIRPR